MMSSGWPGPKRTLEKMGFVAACSARHAGAVEQEDGIVDVACGVAVRSAEGDVVQIEFVAAFRRVPNLKLCAM